MKEKINQFKELINKPNGRTIFFFGFYLVFFLVVAFLARIGDRNTTQASDYEKSNPLNFNIQTLLMNNYHYQYHITMDDIPYFYEGNKNGNYEYFQFQGKEYYRNKDLFFVNNDGVWLKCDNPYYYFDFLDSESIYHLIQLSSYLSKTSYESGKMTYNLLLSTNTINQNLYQVNSDFFEEPNQIILNTDENRRLNHVIYQLDSFCTLNQICEKSLKIDLQFDQFGEIKEIENPIA